MASGNESPDPQDDDSMALSCYARAMDHVGVMSEDPAFRWVERVVLDLHFDACYFQKGTDPGQYRRSGIEVTSPGGGLPAYVGPPHGQVPKLMREVIAWLDRGDLDAHVVVRAAMAHLHLVSVHPFSDGNGRISRIVQSLVLARGGLLAPEFVSIEEYLGRNPDRYYATLQKVQGGSYRPERDAAPWVRLCVDAHLEQARRRLEQLAEAGKRWSFLEALIERHEWPDRLVVALEQSLFHGADRASYAVEAEVSCQTASNDLRRLLDAGLVFSRGTVAVRGMSRARACEATLARICRRDPFRRALISPAAARRRSYLARAGGHTRHPMRRSSVRRRVARRSAAQRPDRAAPKRIERCVQRDPTVPRGASNTPRRTHRYNRPE